MPLPQDQAWFPAKTHGWGWGFPSRWQGWVATGLYLVAMILTALVLPRTAVAARVASIFGLTVALLAICYWKGEKPRWRWGREKPGHANEVNDEDNPPSGGVAR